MNIKAKCFIGLLMATIAIFGMSFSLNTADATALVSKSQTDEEVSDTTSADDWFMKPEETAPIMHEKSDTQATTTEDESKQRFQTLFVTDDMIYYLDTESAKWIKMPYSTSEYIIDAWIKMIPTGNSDYSYPEKYYMEHYYVRPDKKQIQFLCELEVTGKPSNAIEEKKYNPANWENLVPESIEDDVYHNVIRVFSKSKHEPKKPISINEGLEDVLHISL